MDVGIIKSVSIILLPQNLKLQKLIQEYSHPTEELLICKNLEDFVVSLTTQMSEENAFITCYVDDSKSSIDFIQENLLTSIQSVVVTSFPKAVAFLCSDHEDPYVPPPHVQNIIDSTNLIKFINIGDFDFDDEPSKLKFLNELHTIKSTMQFYLFHKIALFKQYRQLEDCQQAILMIREDLGRVYNPEDLPKESLFKNTIKVDIRELTKQVQEDLTDGTYPVGSIDWMFAYVFVNRAKVIFSILASIVIFCFSYFEGIYKVYHAFNYVIPNWKYIEKVVDVEKDKEATKKLNPGYIKNLDKKD